MDSQGQGRAGLSADKSSYHSLQESKTISLSGSYFCKSFTLVLGSPGYDEAVRNLLAVALCVLLSGPLAFAQSAIVRVYADHKNQVHVLYKDGQDVAVAGEQDQVGIDSVKISQDGRTAGWLALYRDPVSS